MLPPDRDTLTDVPEQSSKRFSTLGEASRLRGTSSSLPVYRAFVAALQE